MASVFTAAREGTVEEFMAAFDVERHDPTEWLFQVLTNTAPVERVAMANFLLDRGADASHRLQPNSVLNVLCSCPEHDFQLEAPLLQRLLEAGADVNNRDQYGDVPITELQNHQRALDEEMVPFYQVLLDWPTLDLSLPVSPWNTDGPTVRDSIFASGGYSVPRLQEMIKERGL